MRLVVDSNCLRSPRLAAFLGESRNNRAVLPDFVWIEQYRHNTSEGLLKALAVLRHYPDQIIALKATGAIIKLSPGGGSMALRMVEPTQTRDFAEFCQDVESANNGDVAMSSAIAHRSEMAAALSTLIQEGAVGLMPAYEQIADAFSSDQRKAIYHRRKLDDDTSRILMRAILETFQAWRPNSPIAARPESLGNLTDEFQLRHAVAFVMYALEWIRDGKPLRSAPEKARNNQIDVLLAAYATFFDGIISDDKLVKLVYEQSRFFLLNIGAEVSDASNRY